MERSEFPLRDHFATFRLHPVPMFQLVLHTGAKSKGSPKQFRLDDPNGLVTWAAKDRCTISFESDADAIAKRHAVTRIIRIGSRSCEPLASHAAYALIRHFGLQTGERPLAEVGDQTVRRPRGRPPSASGPTRIRNTSACVTSRSGTTTVGMKYAAPCRPGEIPTPRRSP